MNLDGFSNQQIVDFIDDLSSYDLAIMGAILKWHEGRPSRKGTIAVSLVRRKLAEIERTEHQAMTSFAAGIGDALTADWPYNWRDSPHYGAWLVRLNPQKNRIVRGIRHYGGFYASRVVRWQHFRWPAHRTELLRHVPGGKWDSRSEVGDIPIVDFIHQDEHSPS